MCFYWNRSPLPLFFPPAPPNCHPSNSCYVPTHSQVDSLSTFIIVTYIYMYAYEFTDTYEHNLLSPFLWFVCLWVQSWFEMTLNYGSLCLSLRLVTLPHIVGGTIRPMMMCSLLKIIYPYCVYVCVCVCVPIQLCMHSRTRHSIHAEVRGQLE